MKNEFERTFRDRLLDIHLDFVGGKDDMTDNEMIIEILEILIDKVEKQENHSHSIT